MTGAARSVVTPNFGLYRTDPLPSRWADARYAPRCLYLALLADGSFVRTLAAANGFDFGGYVRGMGASLERRAERVSVVGGRQFHHLGEYEVRGGRVHFTARVRLAGEAFLQRWSLEVLASDVMAGRGEVHRWYGKA